MNVITGKKGKNDILKNYIKIILNIVQRHLINKEINTKYNKVILIQSY